MNASILFIAIASGGYAFGTPGTDWKTLSMSAVCGLACGWLGERLER